MIIFVTGKSGTGKSTFSKILSNKLNYKYIDIDKISHEIYKIPKVIKKTYKLFGSQIFDKDGNFNRKKLGQLIFSNSNIKKVKNFKKFTYKYIKKKLDKEIIENCVIDWILLPLTKYWKLKSFKILLKTENEDLRLNQLVLRDKVSKKYINLRDNNSIEYNEKEFDFIINNDYKNENFNFIISKIINKLN